MKRMIVMILMVSFPVFVYANTLLIDPGSLNAWRKNGGFTRIFHIGDSNFQVSIIKKFLHASYPDVVLGSSPTFGSVTERLLKRFQEENTIPITGVFSGETRERMQDVLTKQVCPPGNNVTEELLHFPVSRTNALPTDYVPPDLVLFPDTVAHVGIMCLRAPALVALGDMFAGAKRDGLYLASLSGFRRVEIQEYLHAKSREDVGEESLRRIAPAGYSEHQMGVAVDLTGSKNPSLITSAQFGKTLPGIWVALNAWKYGFIQSFPPGKESITGYDYEPWHYRYVGIDVARVIHESGKTPLEVLRDVWINEHVPKNNPDTQLLSTYQLLINQIPPAILTTLHAFQIR
jgi:LAS superfamily LD-carboxypeptidase LdcB